MSEPLEARVLSVVASVVGVAVEQLDSESSHENVPNWDSVNVLNLMIALEAEFGVPITIDDASKLIAVKSVCDLLQAKGVR